MDDGSIDSTADIINTCQDSRILYEFCSHNFVDKFNRGVNIARGKYVVLLDRDYMMVPRRLQIQYDFMESHADVALATELRGRCTEQHTLPSHHLLE